MSWRGALYLENGRLFIGKGIGARREQGGEVVFNTGMAGYQEIFTDPSYHKQIVVMTYPHIGNTGVNREDVESSGLSLCGIVVRECCETPSNWRSLLSLEEYLTQSNLCGLADVDTRALTQILRREGSQRGILFPAGELNDEALAKKGRELLEKVEPMAGLELVSQVSCKNIYEFQKEIPLISPSGTVVVYDYGVKANILRHFRRRNFRVWVVPYNKSYQEVLELEPSAVVLSNGPGDPAEVKGAAEEISGLIGKVPLLAICMGHQLLARALGGETFKLKFGHHGVNHPVKDLRTGKVLITSQNHGFSVKEAGLKQKDLTISHINLNDDTVEGFHSELMRLSSVQFHPESAPGPTDAAQVFDSFIKGFIQ